METMADPTPEEKPLTLREQGGAVVSSARSAVLHATGHLEALAELLQVELREYGRCQMRRVVAVAIGGVMLLCAYMLLCVLAVVAFGGMLGLLNSLLAVIGFNAVVGLIILLLGVKCRPAGIAPATTQEIKNDIQCVKLYLKGKEQS